MKSMTGYASAEKTSAGTTVSIEVKSYNSRYLDTSINLPPFLAGFDFKLQELIPQYISRGKVEVYVRVKEAEFPFSVTCNMTAAKEYSDALKSIAQAAGITDLSSLLSIVATQPGVMVSERITDTEKYWNIIEPLFHDVMAIYTQTRVKEGDALTTDILMQLDKLDSFANLVRQYIPTMEQNFKSQTTAKFQDMLGNNYDEQRILQEVAAMLVKYTINEEIVRLEAHLRSLRSEIMENPIPGKKLDFICQEINREVNTIGSKNQSVEIGKGVIAAKDALENIREQARNIE